MLNYGYIRQLNQYNSIQYNGGTARQILYDANGNMTQLGQKVFTYDGRNRMITAVDSSVSPAMQAQYQYDSMGRRISKTVGTSTIRYCYDGAQVIAEYDGSGTLLRRFVYGPGIDEPICMLAYNSEGTETGRYFYHYDGQNNIVGLSNSTGALVEKYTYGVYGLVAIYDGSGTPLTQSAYGNPYYFTGRELDNETGLYYYRARMYEPQLGRFLQPDPIGYADSMNLYRYCGNNPVNYIDPWGLVNTDKHLGRWGKIKRGFWGGVANAAGWGEKAWGSVLDKTEGIRGPVGAVVVATGGTVLVVSNPAGWVFGIAAVTTEVGGILTISDFAYFEKFANRVLDKVREPRQKQEEIIDQIDKYGLKESPQKQSGKNSLGECPKKE